MKTIYGLSKRFQMEIEGLFAVSGSLDDNFLDLDASTKEKVLQDILCIYLSCLKDISTQCFLDHQIACFCSQRVFHIDIALGNDSELYAFGRSGERDSEDFRIRQYYSDRAITRDEYRSGGNIMDSISGAYFALDIKLKFFR